MDRDAREPVAVTDESLEPVGSESHSDSWTERECERIGRAKGAEVGKRWKSRTWSVVCAGGRFRSGAHEMFDSEHLFNKLLARLDAIR